MLSTIVSSLENRINETVLITTGGHLPKILHESPVTKFARKLFDEENLFEYYLNDKKKLYSTYKNQLTTVKSMSLLELTRSSTIHPLFKIDPISYAHFLDKNKVTLINAIIDEALPMESVHTLYKELRGSHRYIMPMTHVSWLPFERFLAQYILLKLNINDRKLVKKALKKQKIESNFIEHFFKKKKF